MKFSSSVDVTQKENKFLRLLVQLLLFVAGILLVIDVLLYDRSPVMVERTSHGLEIVKSTDLSRTPADLQEAASLMIKARFNTDAKSPELFLNPKEMLLRDSEQKDMKSRDMTQFAVIRTVHIEKDEATVEFDRVIAIGDLRSTLKTKVRITFEETTPNELNPYGLLLSTADPVLPPSPVTKEKSR